MKLLLTPIPVLFTGVLCMSQTNFHFQSNTNPRLIEDAFARNPELMSNRVLLDELDRTMNVQDHKYVCCTARHMEIKY